MKKQTLLATASFTAVAVGAALLLRRQAGPHPSRRAPDRRGARNDLRYLPAPRTVLPAVRPPEAAPQRPVPPPGRSLSERDIRDITRNFLLYFVIPLWLASGVADWLCHRTTDIEHTTGTKETMIHLLMLVEMGVPTLAGLFLEVNSPVLALMIASFLLHEATAMWDVSYAVTARRVTPVEQHVHSFLEMLPLMAVSVLTLLNWPVMEALLGRRTEEDRSIRLKRDPLPVGYLATLLGLIGSLEMLPYLEELWRDWRAYPDRLKPPAAARHSAVESFA